MIVQRSPTEAKDPKEKTMNAVRIFHERSPNQNHFWLKHDLFHITETEMTRKTCTISRWIFKVMIVVAIFIFAILFLWHKFYRADVVHKQGYPTSTRKTPTQDERYADYFNLREDKVNPYTVNFTIWQDKVCDGNTYLIIIVPSKVGNHKQRQAIRSTWTKTSFGTVKHVFLLGYSLNTTLNERVREESKAFKDIVQGDFVDSYFNLTLKILMGLKWTHLYCYNASFILKADDDTYVNTHYLIQVLQTNISVDYRGLMIGKINKDGKVRRSGLWKVELSSYPFPHYPQYMFGNTYVISENIAGRLLKASEYMPYIPIEDAYVTGILAKTIRTEQLHVDGFTFWFDAPPKACDFITTKKISATKVSPPMMQLIWDKLKSKFPNC